MRKFKDYLYILDQGAFLRDALDEFSRLRRALEALASEPGNPHHAAETALKILKED